MVRERSRVQSSVAAPGTRDAVRDNISRTKTKHTEPIREKSVKFVDDSFADVPGNAKAKLKKLYVIRAGNSSFFKVGISDDPRSRLKNLQVGSALKLRLIRSVASTSKSFEREAHAILKKWHSRGEWFDFKGRAEAFSQKASICAKGDLFALLRDVDSLPIAKAIGPYNEWDEDYNDWDDAWINRHLISGGTVDELLETGYSQDQIDRYANPQDPKWDKFRHLMRRKAEGIICRTGDCKRDVYAEGLCRYHWPHHRLRAGARA